MKKVNTCQTIIVEFTIPEKLYVKLKSIQCKVEDGAISVGLGNKAGNGIIEFNECIKNKEIYYRVVKVKRRLKKT